MDKRETIYFVSDFIFFSNNNASEKYQNVLEALIAHIKYLQRKSRLSFNLDERKWLKLARQELQRRKRSRVALKFFIALPRKLININQFYKQLRAFLAKELQVPPKFIAIAFAINDHNPHAHILIFPRKYNGKKLSLNKQDLRRFHRNLKTFWKRIGYTLKLKTRLEQKLPHFGEAIKELPYNITKQGIVLFKLKAGLKTKILLPNKLNKKTNTTFPVYWITKINNRYLLTHFWFSNLKNLIDKINRIILSSQVIKELWIISDKEKTSFLIFLKINKKTERKGGKKYERSRHHN